MANNAGSSLNIRNQISKIHQVISTSYHEAGHAIYSLLHGMKVHEVFIYENKKNKRIEGACNYEMPEVDIIKDAELASYLLLSEIGIKYAGLTSEKYFFKIISGSDKFPIFLKDGSSDDTLSAAKIIKKYNISPPGKERYSFKKRKINEVLKELSKNWDDVILISHALVSKKKLSFLDIKNILVSKSIYKKFWKKQFKKIDVIFFNLEMLDERELKFILFS